MNKETQLFNLATMTSNAFGIESKIAGYEGTMFCNDDDANINGTIEDYVNNVATFADLLINEDLEAVYQLDDDELIEARALVEKLKGYDEDTLKRIARDDWMEREEAAAAEEQ